MSFSLPQIAAVCVGQAGSAVPDDAVVDVVLDAVGAAQSGQKVTEMLPITLVMVSGIMVDEAMAAELVVGGVALGLGSLGRLVVVIAKGVDDASRVAEVGIEAMEETSERILLATSGMLTAGTDELDGNKEGLDEAIGELIAVELLAMLEDPVPVADLFVKVAVDELLETVELPMVALVEDGNVTVLAMQALLTEFVGAFGVFKKATWMAPITRGLASWKCSFVPCFR